MAEALTRKQVIQAVWNKFKAIIGNKDISGIGDGTVTGAIAGLNGKLKTLSNIAFMTKIINPNNTSPAAVATLRELFPNQQADYTNTFVYAYNADEDSNNRQVEKITVRQNGQILLYFNENFSENMRVNFIGFLFR